MKQRKLYRLNSYVTIIIFLLAIYVPFLIGIISEDELISEGEKRSLVQMPEKPKTRAELNAFPRLFDSFYSDQFGLRGWFTEVYGQFKFHLGDSPTEDVTIGKDGWLFLGSVKKTGNRGVIDDVRNVNLYTEVELEKFARYIAGLDYWLDERKIKYIFVIAPNKHTIYFDKLPNYISRVGNKSATDQLVGFLRKHTDVRVVDLRDTLINNKENHQLYFKTDTHWNHNGANIAQYEIIKIVESLFPDNIESQLFSLTNAVSGGGDLARMVGIDTFTEQNPQPIFENTCSPIKYPPDAKRNEPHSFTCEGQELTALIFRDSFFNALEPYFSRKLLRSTYISEASSWSALNKYIKLESPDIVIEEWVERDLPLVPKTNEEFEKSFDNGYFRKNRKIIFSSRDSKLKFNKWLVPLKSDDENLHLKAIGKDPIILLPPLQFEASKRYVLHINMKSSVDSSLQIFYSEADNPRKLFSEKNSIRVKVSKGENDLYVNLDQQNLGARLRIDPISKLGVLDIELIVIRESEALF